MQRNDGMWATTRPSLSLREHTGLLDRYFREQHPAERARSDCRMGGEYLPAVAVTGELGSRAFDASLMQPGGV